MIWVLRYYVRYVVCIMIVGVFAYIFQLIYSSDSAGLLLTAFIASSLGLLLYATR